MFCRRGSHGSGESYPLYLVSSRFIAELRLPCLRKLPTDMKFRLADAVSKVDLNHLPSLDDFKLRNDRDGGLSL